MLLYENFERVGHTLGKRVMPISMWKAGAVLCALALDSSLT